MCSTQIEEGDNSANTAVEVSIKQNATIPP